MANRSRSSRTGAAKFFGLQIQSNSPRDTRPPLRSIDGRLDEAGVKPPFREIAPLVPEVLAFPTVLNDAEIYSFSNESMDRRTVNIVDALTGAHIHFTMRPQRGAALLLSRQGTVLSSYGDAAADAK